MLSHAGAARFAFNAGLAHVKAGIEAGEKLDWSYYALVRWWNANKDALAVDADGAPWWHETWSWSWQRDHALLEQTRTQRVSRLR